MIRNNLALENGQIYFPSKTTDSYVLDDFSLRKITVDEGANIDILLTKFNKDLNIEIDLGKNAEITIKGVVLEGSKNIEIIGNLRENSRFSCVFLDFSSGQFHAKSDIKCIGNNSNASFRVASLATKNDKKQIAFSIDHIALNTNGLVDNYGVCKDESFLEFSGVNHIAKGAKKTVTRQGSKIMLIDKTSDGVAKPILKIDESDVSASHGAAIGQINEEQLFYLQTRGISESEARRLIVLGYFIPVLRLFEKEEGYEEISNLLMKKL